MFDLTAYKKELDDRVEHFQTELTSVRTGRAAPALLDSVRVDTYGTTLPLQQVGSVTIEDARSLRITPWDLSQVKAIEKAIAAADLGVSVGSDEKGVRVSFPELTSERREQLVKLTRAKLEEARTSIRQSRDHVWSAIQKQEKDKALSEDDKFRAKEQMEKITKDHNEALEQLAEKKEAELRA